MTLQKSSQQKSDKSPECSHASHLLSLGLNNQAYCLSPRSEGFIPIRGQVPFEVQASPFLKWVGGKTQLLQQFEQLYPRQLKEGKVKKYFELFLGGGAVFLNIIQKYPVEQVFLSDINQDLILAYKVIQNKADNLIELLLKLQQTYCSSNVEQREKLFYQIRENYNQQQKNFNYDFGTQEATIRVSWLVFLNKTCFNGLYRTNQKGDFNVPFGKYKNPKICNSENILAVAQVLQKVTLVSGNYHSLDEFIDNQSFVYLDPPYRPINKTSSFTAYAKSGFNDQNQIELSNYYRHLSEVKQSLLMLSNSNPHNIDATDNFFHQLYQQYKIHEVLANRMVNSDATKRGKIAELVITNY